LFKLHAGSSTPGGLGGEYTSMFVCGVVVISPGFEIEKISNILHPHPTEQIELSGSEIHEIG
jgi:hypothetical protein